MPEFASLSQELAQIRSTLRLEIPQQYPNSKALRFLRDEKDVDFCIEDLGRELEHEKSSDSAMQSKIKKFKMLKGLSEGRYGDPLEIFEELKSQMSEEEKKIYLDKILENAKNDKDGPGCAWILKIHVSPPTRGMCEEFRELITEAVLLDVVQRAFWYAAQHYFIKDGVSGSFTISSEFRWLLTYWDLVDLSRAREYVDISKLDLKEGVIYWEYDDMFNRKAMLFPDERYTQLFDKCKSKLGSDVELGAFLASPIIRLIIKGVCGVYETVDENVEDKPTELRKQLLPYLPYLEAPKIQELIKSFLRYKYAITFDSSDDYWLIEQISGQKALLEYASFSNNEELLALFKNALNLNEPEDVLFAVQCGFPENWMPAEIRRMIKALVLHKISELREKGEKDEASSLANTALENGIIEAKDLVTATLPTQ